VSADRAPGTDFELAPLDCPTCGAAVEAHGEDVVYYCTSCRNGYAFDVARRELEPVEVQFVSAPNVAVDSYLPFWLLPAEVKIHQRKASGGNFSGLLNFFVGGDEGGGVPAGQGTFVVPAFHCSLPALTALTRAYTERTKDLGELIGERLLGGRYGVDDARKLAHYALIASEVGKPDTLRRLEYEIDFGEPTLLGVPFTRQGEGLADALFGIAV
jgi:hypothetical protein